MHACVENLTAFVSAYGATMQAIVRHVNFQQIKCLLLGSPGFVKDDFFEFLNMEAVRREERVRLATAIALLSTFAWYSRGMSYLICRGLF